MQEWLPLSIARHPLPPPVAPPLPSGDNEQCSNDRGDHRPEEPRSQEPLPDILGLLEVGRQELLNKSLACGEVEEFNREEL